MRFLLPVFSVLTVMSFTSFAQVPLPAASPAVAASPAPAVVAPVVAAAPAVIAVAPSVQGPAIAVSEPSAPPKWAQDLMVNLQKFPVVGPILTKVMIYAGIIASILTMLVAFLLSVLGSLSGIAGLAGLDKVKAAILDFKNGKIMYWITYLSMFNAKKPDVVQPSGDTLGKVS